MDIIYLDNSSTTAPCTSAVQAASKAMTDCWGNPSSLHRLGLEAENLINSTRTKISDILGCRYDEIFFTGSGTEANNTCLIGAAEAMKRRGNKIITTSVEHPSVLNTCAHLEQSGFEIVKIKPHADGSINADDVLNVVDKNTVLVSVMLVNNETGAVFPVLEIAEGLKSLKSSALFHTDCVQAFGKLDIDVGDLGVDLLTASGHKIHGPKGIGFFYKKKSANIKPLINGGNQERGLRSGTEPVPLIAALGGALEELDTAVSLRKLSALHSYALDRLLKIDGISVNSPQNSFLPYILNISVLGYRSETLLHFLEKKNIFVSSGSACSKGKGSYVLREMGISDKLADSALRISFSKHNTEADIDALCSALEEAKATLRRK